MSSFPARNLEIWKSSRAEAIAPISGAFAFDVIPTLMVNQTIEFLHERARQHNFSAETNPLLNPFFSGMYWYSNEKPNRLMWDRGFESANELFEFDLGILFDAINQLELHTDINIIYNQITYLADQGRGPEVPLLVAKRID